MIKSNGGIIGPDNVTTGGAFGSASGVFKLGEVTNLIKESKWPTAGPQGFQVANSCRFNDGSSDNLSRTQESSANSQIFTYSTWVKRSGLTGVKQEMVSGGSASTDFDMFYFDTSERLSYYSKTSGSENLDLATTKVFRDLSAWYHIVLAVDTTQGTASNRVKLYVNGVLETAYAVGTYPSVNTNLFLNKASQSQRIGRQAYSAIDFFDGYMAETVMIDGSQLAPTSFGEFNSQTGIWVPKSVTGLTFGTNGFYQNYSNSGALGEDFSGNDNDFTVNNLTSLDQSTDTCSTNFATWNPLRTQAGFSKTMADGNLSFTNSAGDNASIPSTMAASSGKWYAEFKCTTNPSNWGFGIAQVNQTILSGGSMGGYPDSQGGVTYTKNGNLSWYNGGDQSSSTGTTFATNDIIAILMDLDNTRVYWYKNDVLVNSGGFNYSVVNNGSTLENNYYFMAGSTDGGTDPILVANFGSPSYAISSGNTDANGFGNFEYTTKGGLALNTKNLAAVLG